MSQNKTTLKKVIGRKPEAEKEGDVVIPETLNRSDFSDKSIEVLETFGLEAPTLLNQYACAVEDHLIDAIAKIKDLRAERQVITDAYSQLREEFNEYKANALREKADA